ncbi:hypothetical protein [Mycobacterium sp. PSTR-4-N]|uniref:hypothetical protein n=1 Tax=Mycobacterium sp. PSTR-4-N TaxID=2917745 RepID=UPI001F1535D9|nr:hypothetical protein [Mycobacterium sp. PSTR-4-N]
MVKRVSLILTALDPRAFESTRTSVPPASLRPEVRRAPFAFESTILSARRLFGRRFTRDIHAAGPVGADVAATRLIGQLSRYDRTILSRRVWALQPEPLRDVADIDRCA